MKRRVSEGRYTICIH